MRQQESGGRVAPRRRLISCLQFYSLAPASSVCRLSDHGTVAVARRSLGMQDRPVSMLLINARGRYALALMNSRWRPPLAAQLLLSYWLGGEGTSQKDLLCLGVPTRFLSFSTCGRIMPEMIKKENIFFQQ